MSEVRTKGTIICVWGDSIAYGEGDYEQGGWVRRLRRFLDQKTLSNPENYLESYNLGVSGDTTTDLLERFQVECRVRLGDMEENESSIIIFAIGINDAQFIHDKNDLRTPLEEFKENIQKLIDLSQKFKSEIVFIGLNPVDESKTIPIPWDINKSYKNENVQKYNEIIKSVCKENNIPFIDIFEQWIRINYKELLFDGLHPNSKGHQMISDVVIKTILKLSKRNV